MTDRIWNESLSIQSQQRAARHRRVAAFAHFVCETTTTMMVLMFLPKKGSFWRTVYQTFIKGPYLQTIFLGQKGTFWYEDISWPQSWITYANCKLFSLCKQNTKSVLPHLQCVKTPLTGCCRHGFFLETHPILSNCEILHLASFLLPTYLLPQRDGSLLLQKTLHVYL